ncbi:MAG TPA: hypothetical protein VGS21_12275 [Acidimicrobiales bacterium]|nr:hypothetical protein [Acidimicrobiales bacterium]
MGSTLSAIRSRRAAVAAVAIAAVALPLGGIALSSASSAGMRTQSPVGRQAPPGSAGHRSPAVLETHRITVTKQADRPSPVTPRTTGHRPVKFCSYPVVHDMDGNAWPIFCQDGRLNTDAWDYFAAMRPHVFALGSGASRALVLAAACYDWRTLHLTNPIEDNVMQLASARYGWPYTLTYFDHGLIGQICTAGRE